MNARVVKQWEIQIAAQTTAGRKPLDRPSPADLTCPPRRRSPLKKTWPGTGGAAVVVLVLAFPAAARAGAAPSPPPAEVPRFELIGSGLELERATEPGKFFDVVGRRSAVFGYENRALEYWVYPLKLIDDFKLSFQLEGYPLEIEGTEIATGIRV